ncbi:hypothetical protein OBBRIDRAFT_37742 [Obba rivulosa]|uniref:Uncharacterized protein n=1 Tax=Obba rivulosa TaxID=1052685 RepID=A0A8E2AYU1_9APHY|nr:hypothetical protein OBBRIDRAFT_37742 [Obba rivulosa]
MARRGEKQQLSPGSLTQVSDSTTQLSSVRFVSFISEMAGELATGFNGDPIEINEVDGVMAASQAETSGNGPTSTSRLSYNRFGTNYGDAGSPEQESGRWRSCSPASQNTRRDV